MSSICAFLPSFSWTLPQFLAPLDVKEDYEQNVQKKEGHQKQRDCSMFPTKRLGAWVGSTGSYSQRSSLSFFVLPLQDRITREQNWHRGDNFVTLSGSSVIFRWSRGTHKGVFTIKAKCKGNEWTERISLCCWRSGEIGEEPRN